MLSLEQVEAFSAFKRQIARENVAKDFDRFQTLARIGADAARAWQQIAFLHQCVELEGNARWWHYLQLVDIECDHRAFQSERRDTAAIRRLVPALLRKSNFDLYTVLEFTRHYQLDDSVASLAYVDALLLEPTAAGDRSYQDKIVGVLDDIHEPHLVSLLLKSIDKIAGSDYDRLLFVFQLLLEHTRYDDRDEVERRVDVLRILQTHAAALARVEATSATGPAASRLVSFHDVIAAPRDVLAQLLRPDTFETLLDLAGPLRLQTDELQMLLLKQMVEQHVRLSPSEAIDDITHETRSALPFAAFEAVLERLTDTENKVTAAEWLAENVQASDDKLYALEFALAAASGEAATTLTSADSDRTAQQTFTGADARERLEAKILRMRIERVLNDAVFDMRSGLDPAIQDDKRRELLQLVAQPTELLSTLYRRYALVSFECGRITLHDVADKLEAIAHVSAHKVQRDLIRAWLVEDAVLRPSSSSSSLDAAPESVFAPLDDEVATLHDDAFVQRIVFVATQHAHASASRGAELVEYLLRFANDDKPRAGVTFRAKLRALRALLHLAQAHHALVASAVESTSAATSADTFIDELVDTARHVSHMIVLEERRTPFDLALVRRADKEAFARSLLRQFGATSPWVLRCVSRVMLDFQVDAIDVWTTVVASMRRLGMERALSRVLEALSARPWARQLEHGAEIWEHVMLAPLQRLSDAAPRIMDLSLDFGEDAVDRSAAERPSSHGETTSAVAPSTANDLVFCGVPVERVRIELEHMLTLLETCPFLDEIDVPAFVIRLKDLADVAARAGDRVALLERLDLFGFAVRCALLIPKPLARVEALTRIIHAGASMAVLRELLDTTSLWTSETFDASASVDTSVFGDQIRLVHTAFAEIVKREEDGEVLGTPFEQSFLEFVAATGSIDRVVGILYDS